MSGFDADWLAQREPFDLAARSRALEDAFAEALMRQRAAGAAPLRLADLGGGTAANFRALAPRLDGDQQWVLLDFDQQLLDQAPARVARWARTQGWEAVESAGRCEVHAGPARWRLETQRIDLAASLEALDARRFDGIVTTAFLDLVSSQWLARFARWLVDADRPLLATLTVDGRRSWHPKAIDDELIDRAFRAHQGGDKGFGESVGPGACAALADCLRALDCPVALAQSDWQIGGSADSAMLDRMADEAVAVALEIDRLAGDRLARWRQTRAAQIASGQARLVVGHVDLLATPGQPSALDLLRETLAPSDR
jgi:hypothetical protein